MDEQRKEHCRRRRILIVDEYADAAESLCDVLRLDGHAAAFAVTCSQALDLAREFRPEVVVSEVGIRCADGQPMTDSIRAERGLGAVRLIALSGRLGAAEVEAALRAGFDAYLRKPADLERLLALLQN